MLVLASDDDTEPPVAIWCLLIELQRTGLTTISVGGAGVIAAQAQFPGYLAPDFFKPHGKQDEWIDIVRYKSAAGLAAWMESKERRALLKELEPHRREHAR